MSSQGRPRSFGILSRSLTVSATARDRSAESTRSQLTSGARGFRTGKHIFPVATLIAGMPMQAVLQSRAVKDGREKLANGSLNVSWPFHGKHLTRLGHVSKLLSQFYHAPEEL